MMCLAENAALWDFAAFVVPHHDRAKASIADLKAGYLFRMAGHEEVLGHALPLLVCVPSPPPPVLRGANVGKYESSVWLACVSCPFGRRRPWPMQGSLQRSWLR